MHLFLTVAFVCVHFPVLLPVHTANMMHSQEARGRGAIEKHAGLAVGTDQNTAALI